MSSDNCPPLANEKLKQRSMTLNVGNNLHTRLKKHIHLLKRLKSQNYTLQRWMNDAINEKLKSSEINALTDQKETYIMFKLEKDLFDRVEQRVQLLKKVRRSYSKKQLFIEAISEKLEKDDFGMQELLQKLIAANKMEVQNKKKISAISRDSL
jgi:hypothetical protein